MKNIDSQNVRDTVYVGATVVGAAATAYLVWRMMAGPDAQREMIMAYYHKAREHAKQRAEYWGALADKYGELYINAGQVIR